MERGTSKKSGGAPEQCSALSATSKLGFSPKSMKQSQKSYVLCSQDVGRPLQIAETWKVLNLFEARLYIYICIYVYIICLNSRWGSPIDPNHVSCGSCGFFGMSSFQVLSWFRRQLLQLLAGFWKWRTPQPSRDTSSIGERKVPVRMAVLLYFFIYFFWFWVLHMPGLDCDLAHSRIPGFTQPFGAALQAHPKQLP